MSMMGPDVDESVESEIDDRVIRLMGGGGAVVNVVAFTVVGALALGDVIYGAITGVFMGAGAFLFVPWLLRLSAVQNGSNDELPFSEVIRRAGGNPQLGAYGFGLELGGIVMIAIGFVLEEPNAVYGILAAVAVAVAVSAVASVLLARTP